LERGGEKAERKWGQKEVEGKCKQTNNNKIPMEMR
jgi:hypothetical protein